MQLSYFFVLSPRFLGKIGPSNMKFNHEVCKKLCKIHSLKEYIRFILDNNHTKKNGSVNVFILYLEI